MMRSAFPGLLLAAALLAGCASPVVPPIEGIVWQIDNENTQPRGDWEKLGVHRLLVQWSAVDDLAFVEGTTLAPGAKMPDWKHIGAQPWAREVILGLAGHFDERKARADIEGLVKMSAQLATKPPPVNVTAWYFPVEIDPTWMEAPFLKPLLGELPTPLWISVYDSANVGPEELAQSLVEWLPPHVGVFFQDGVGVHAREPFVARHYANVLARRLGRDRVRVIAEAFRPKQGGGFRPATLAELRPQLASYAGFPIYLFEGPRYVSSQLVQELAAAQKVGK
jgi:hypothetical protein